MNLVEVQNLQQIYYHRKREQLVFKNMNFQIQKGEFVTLLGPSGCGKSTLLRILSGLETPTSGQILDHSRRKSFVFQEPRLLPWRSSLENILLPLEIQNKSLSPEDFTKARELLSRLGLAQAELKYPAQLSGGMKMRNAVARSLILDPDFLLMDEPFAALDESNRQLLQVELRKLFESMSLTAVFVTHSIEEACFLSSRILIFSKAQSGLIEYRSSLPNQRSAEMRDQIQFFDEVKKVRKLFQQEAL